MSYLVLVSVVASIPTLWFVAPHLYKLRQIAKLRRICENSKVIVLTYDDGPGSSLTPALLKVLENSSVHANFFMLGRKIDSFPHEAFDVASKGHLIGSHSLEHLHAWKTSPLKIGTDIRVGFQKCGEITTSKWFRPPFGKITLATLIQILITHHRLAWWTIDSTDTWPNPLPIEQIIERVRKENGGVVLMHDHDRDNTYMHNYVIGLTQGLIQLARDEGYAICTFQNLHAK